VSKVKKLIASRKLKSTCVRCDKEFPKGDIYKNYVKSPRLLSVGWIAF